MFQKLMPTRAMALRNRTGGGSRPLLLQSMISAPTEDTEAALAEIRALAEAGFDLVRLTVQTPAVAESLAALRQGLDAEGISVPLSADIHFSPSAALLAADLVEKVRINPGNFSDRRAERDESDEGAEERRRENFLPLVEKCARLGRAIRVGVNHGSLAGRILARWGDTPRGMVESALEYLRLAEEAGFADLVVSLKASNVRVMVEANRLFALEQLRRREAEGLPVYPIHLGVTEAGEGEDGRIRSFLGMASLLEYGIGDTVRVSLAEDAINELPACRALARRYDPPRSAAEAWTSAALSAAFEAAGSDAETGALPPSAGPTEAPRVILLPSGGWQPEALPAEPFMPDEVGEAEGPSLRAAGCQNEDALLGLVVQAGLPLLEGRANAITVEASNNDEASTGCRLAFALLQAARLRMSRADFIACPSCGRTHFDLQEILARVRARFGHLAGLKLAVMGCIVNGPGEMADADFGYVGAAPGKVDLYEGREPVEKGIPAAEAVDRLQVLLERRGLWREP